MMRRFEGAVATATISSDALVHNFNCVKQIAAGAKVIAVVKADAYGHGIERVVPVLTQADMFAVAKPSEAVSVRAYTQRPILLLSAFDQVADWAFFQHYNVHIVVHTMAQYQQLLATDSVLNVWLKIDTGMHRLGITPEDCQLVWQRLSKKKNINIVAVMHHFARADEQGHSFNQHQLSCLDQYAPPSVAKSAANSAAILSLPESFYQFVRPGIMLYGISPFHQPLAQLKAVMELSAPVIDVKTIKQGEGVGYNHIWVSDKNTTIAVVAIGYGDGYPRAVKQGTPVLINDKRCSLVGRVSMDLICVDVANHHVQIGDRALLWGKDLPIEHIAECAGTIGYELTTQLTKRVVFV